MVVSAGSTKASDGRGEQGAITTSGELVSAESAVTVKFIHMECTDTTKVARAESTDAAPYGLQ